MLFDPFFYLEIDRNFFYFQRIIGVLRRKKVAYYVTGAFLSEFLRDVKKTTRCVL